jgi:hypothetical protein
LVEARSNGVRFRHSIMQAYLGSRAIGRLLTSPDFLAKALDNPGREVLMALVMYSFGSDSEANRGVVRTALLANAQTREDDKSLDMFATAVEIGSMDASENEAVLDESVQALWMIPRGPATVPAKLRAVARMGDLSRRKERANGRTFAASEQRIDAYRALWRLCAEEPSYPVRMAAAQELGAGGPAAFASLAGTFEETLQDALAAHASGVEVAPEVQRRFAVQGWILPMLAASAVSDQSNQAITLIRGWTDMLCKRGAGLTVEASWAQGFKYEANRLRKPADLTMRGFLAEQAERLLESAGFWYSRISLLQAFTLWLLRAPVDEDASTPRGRAGRSRRRKSQEAARRIVQGWTTDRSHPFVREAASLCELALETGTPGRYMWIDEAGVIAKLGPQEAGRAHREQPPLDLARSRLARARPAGAPARRRDRGDPQPDRALGHARARSAPPARERQSPAVPGRGRWPGAPAGRRGRGYPRAPARFDVHAQLPLHLCSYPPPGQLPFRGELSEAFCRDQRRILEGHHGPASWQRQQRLAELKEFWSNMEARTRR